MGAFKHNQLGFIRIARQINQIQFGISLIIFAVYWGLFLGGIAMSLKGTLPPSLGTSLPNIVFLILGTFSFISTAKR